MKVPFSKLVEKYFNYLERKGKKYVMVSYTGHVYGYRYFPLFEETADKVFPYPNFSINQLMYSDEDEVIPHSHPWAVMSFIVKGGYSHYFNGKWTRKEAPAMIMMTSNGIHGIDKVSSDSVSIFCHWFKKKEWKIEKQPNAEGISYALTVNDGNIPHDGVAVIKYTPEIAKKIKIRQKAFARIIRNT